MRKTVLILLLLITVSFGVNAATPVKFMGIPVCGTVPEMARKLEGKGFEDCGDNLFQGYFAGELVFAVILAMENRVVGISVGHLCRSESDVVEEYNTIYSKIIMKNNYYYAKGRKITAKDISHVSRHFGNEFNTIFYQMAYKNEKFEDCKSRRVELNLSRRDDLGCWLVTLTYANVDVFDDDY